MASGMVLKAGLEVPFGCWWGDIVGGCWWYSSLDFVGLRSSTLQCMYRLNNGVVWYPRTVSLSRKVPNADVAECSMLPGSFLFLSSSRIIKVYDGQRVCSRKCSSRTGYVHVSVCRAILLRHILIMMTDLRPRGGGSSEREPRRLT